MPRAALRGGVHDGEGVEEGIHHVDHQQEERGGRQQRELDAPEPAPWASAINRGRFNQRLGDGLQACQEEQEVVGDLLPHSRNHDQRHGVVGVEQVVPVKPRLAQQIRHHAQRGGEHEHPQHARHGRGHRIRQQQCGFVHQGPAHDAVGKDGQHQRDGDARDRDGDREKCRRLERGEIARVFKQVAEVFQPHPFGGHAKGILHLERLHQRLARRPEEEDADHDQLG